MPMNSFSAMSDSELVVLASGDDQEAFACLFGRYNAMIHGKAVAKSKLCGCDITDDLAQEAAIGFLKAVRSYDPAKGASFHTFAERCVDNMLTSAVRSYFSGKNTFLNDHGALEASESGGEYGGISSGDDIAGYVIDAESNADVLSGFSELERSVIEMRMKGMSYDETAKALGVSVKSVDNAIQRVRQKFRSVGRNG